MDDNWNMCDSWPADVYEVLYDDGIIYVQMMAAEYHDDDGTTYFCQFNHDTNSWDIYWKSSDD